MYEYIFINDMQRNAIVKDCDMLLHVDQKLSTVFVQL